ncbi:hypothetical protein [Bacillus sp. JJ722]|uniref:hypothetical protein n=1 Tax=Bacillus sp. JJ722 TaxID=3122973 RepID=UPI003000DE5A
MLSVTSLIFKNANADIGMSKSPLISSINLGQVNANSLSKSIVPSENNKSFLSSYLKTPPTSMFIKEIH